jgi:hypothetical protein
MSQGDEWSPDEQPEAETFEQGDEALGESSRVSSSFSEEVQQDPSLDPALQLDLRELEEIGAELDDPESLVTLEGGIDDPDGTNEPTDLAKVKQSDDEGWELDTPLAKETGSDESFAD